MAQSVEALITPKVLLWAREKSGFTVEQVADKMHVPVEKLYCWENGESLPTVIQARSLADVYKRPFAMFYMEEPPADFDILKDFRKLDLSERRPYSAILNVIIRKTKDQQEWLHDYLTEQEFDSIPYIGKCTLNDDPVDIAQYIHGVLSVDKSELKKYRTRAERLKKWIEIFEANRVFVTRGAKVELDECRGFTIIDNIAPIIFLNTRDADVGQLFTLIHEFTHLLLGESAITNSKLYGHYLSKEYDAAEVFCNKVASYTLLNQTEFIEKFRSMDNEKSLEENIERLSNTFVVSEEVIARRMLDSGIINDAKYQELRKYYIERWNLIYTEKRRKMKENEGGPSYYITQLSYNGRAFTQIVINAYLGNRISCRNVSSLLNMKINNLSKMAEALGMGYFG